MLAMMEAELYHQSHINHAEVLDLFSLQWVI